MPVYLTRAVDTPASVARRFSLPVEELCRLNGLEDRRRLTEGLALYLPEEGQPVRSLELLGCPYEPLPAARRAALLPRLSWWAGGETPGEAEAAGAAPLLLRAGWTRGGGWSAETVHAWLQDRETADTLVREVGEGAYSGLYWLLGEAHPFDARPLAAMTEALAEKLHAAGKYLFLGLSVEAETLFPAAAAADRVVLLAPASFPSGPLPRPNAPLDALTDQLMRAVGVLPADRLLLGLSAYGTCWDARGPVPITQAAALHLAVASGARVCWDAQAGECRFRCPDALGQPRTVWFEDLRAFRARVELVDALGLIGLALQSAPLPCTASWSWLHSRYEVRTAPM